MRISTFQRLVVVTALAACTKASPPPPAPDAAAIRTAIAAELNKLAPLSQTKDAAGFAALFTDDATWIMPDASIFAGRAAIEKGVRAVLAAGDSSTVTSMNIDRLIVISDTEAVTFTTGSYTVYAKGKKPDVRVNPFADHWKKGADGTWRIAYEVNADGPAPAAAK